MRVVIATTAFGIGIDCPDIRRIIHFCLLSDVQAYAKETGRAGRDMQQSVACLMCSKAESDTIMERMRGYGENKSTRIDNN